MAKPFKHKITLLSLLVCSSFSEIYSQPSFKRAWGAVKKNVARPSIAEINPTTGDLFVLLHIGELGPNFTGTKNEIHQINRSNATSSLTYLFPPPVFIPATPTNPSEINETSFIDNFKIDNNSNFIIIGRTYKPNLATTGAYSSQMIQNSGEASGFITKVSPSGKVIWFTYFNALSQNKEQLAIDPNNNIYVVSKRNKTDVLTGSKFQNTGDLSSSKNDQDVINKFDTNGKHQWSTFYTKDLSEITGIDAGINGLYVYGNHFSSTAQSNYFGTKNSHQEYASGVMLWGQPSNACNVFLSKFNFDGTRAWSTYFGNQISKNIYNDVSQNSKNLVVIDDDAYFITCHTNIGTLAPSLATSNVFLTTPPSLNLDPITLTKINGSGKRQWTTYLYAGETLSKSISGNELHLSAVIEKNHPNINLLTDSKSYQQQQNGLKDVYSYTMSLDGKTRNNASFYGFEGNDLGISFPTVNGYYVMGRASHYTTPTNLFTTAGTQSDPFALAPTPIGSDGYIGNFISYFTNKSLSLLDKELYNQLNIYPNPVEETLNIQTSEPLTEDTQITVFDVAGKRVLATYAKDTELNQINVSSLKSGVYILQLSSSSLNQSHKFIKK